MAALIFFEIEILKLGLTVFILILIIYQLISGMDYIFSIFDTIDVVVIVSIVTAAVCFYFKSNANSSSAKITLSPSSGILNQSSTSQSYPNNRRNERSFLTRMKSEDRQVT